MTYEQVFQIASGQFYSERAASVYKYNLTAKPVKSTVASTSGYENEFVCCDSDEEITAAALVWTVNDAMLYYLF